MLNSNEPIKYATEKLPELKTKSTQAWRPKSIPASINSNYQHSTASNAI